MKTHVQHIIRRARQLASIAAKSGIVGNAENTFRPISADADNSNTVSPYGCGCVIKRISKVFILYSEIDEGDVVMSPETDEASNDSRMVKWHFKVFSLTNSHLQDTSAVSVDAHSAAQPTGFSHIQSIANPMLPNRPLSEIVQTEPHQNQPSPAQSLNFNIGFESPVHACSMHAV